MKGQDLLMSVQDIDNKYVSETAEYKKAKVTKMPRRWLKVAAIAAAVVLVATVAIVALTKKPAENIASLTDEPTLVLTDNDIARDVPLGVRIQMVSYYAQNVENAPAGQVVDNTGNGLQEIAFGPEGFVENSIPAQMGDLMNKMMRYVDLLSIPSEMTLNLERKTYHISTKWPHPGVSPYDMSFMEWYKVDRLTVDGEERDISQDLKEYAELETVENRNNQCRTEAMQIAQQLINIDDYELTVDEREGVMLRFHKKLFGYDTCARLNVSVIKNEYYMADDADIEIGIGRILIDEMDALISSYDEAELKATLDKLGDDAVETAIQEKLKSAYPQLSNWELGKRMVVNAPDNEIGMVYVMDTFAPDENDPSYKLRYSAVFFVVLDDSSKENEVRFAESEPQIVLNELSQNEDENGNEIGVYADDSRWFVGPRIGDVDNQGLFPDTLRVSFGIDMDQAITLHPTGVFQQIISGGIYSPYIMAKYESDNCTFYLKGNGSLCIIDYKKDDAGNILAEKKGNKTIDDLRSIAIRIANLNVPCSDLYDISESTDGNLCTFGFSRKICGYDTTAKAHMVFNTCGDMLHFDSMMTDEFGKLFGYDEPSDLKELLAMLDSDETITLIDERVGVTAPDSEYEIQKKTVTVTPDYSVGMIFQVRIADTGETRYFLVTRQPNS